MSYIDISISDGIVGFSNDDNNFSEKGCILNVWMSYVDYLKYRIYIYKCLFIFLQMSRPNIRRLNIMFYENKPRLEIISEYRTENDIDIEYWHVYS